MYDFNFQRRNMTNYCGPADSDPARRNSWGVDLNRNFSVGSLFDGYFGASSNCRSDVFAGPAELSEPESRNEVWLTGHFPNIKFAMNTHSYGGYFMWPPGSYREAGRVTLPYVDLGTDTYFWAASDHILSAVQAWRGTGIWPGRTGPVTDVLYSAAGNSSDDHWYNHGIIGWDFEVGADRYDPQTGQFNGVGFQPPFAEGHEEAMEFANGQVAILEAALAYAKDREPPRSDLVVTDRQDGATTFTFSVNEPATVYYTLDGSRPTLASPKLRSAGQREGAETITVTRTTEVHWFTVDIAGKRRAALPPRRHRQQLPPRDRRGHRLARLRTHRHPVARGAPPAPTPAAPGRGTRPRWRSRIVLATIVAMKTLPIGDARDGFSALVASVEQTHDRVIVTRNGMPAAVIVSPADLEELEETIAVLASSALLRQLIQSREDIERDDVIDAAEDREALLAAIRSRSTK